MIRAMAFVPMKFTSRHLLKPPTTTITPNIRQIPQEAILVILIVPVKLFLHTYNNSTPGTFSHITHSQSQANNSYS